jgi:hypothetical protein
MKLRAIFEIKTYNDDIREGGTKMFARIMPFFSAFCLFSPPTRGAGVGAAGTTVDPIPAVIPAKPKVVVLYSEKFLLHNPVPSPAPFPTSIVLTTGISIMSLALKNPNCSGRRIGKESRVQV